ncbi:tRNA-dihydrouridine synthase family protein [Planctomicrobium sp.]|jgi:tRNA-dihydrouridine synthase B|nr:tRNA-dihydrouridine synthase family protein [Planctomicrobium sp.]MBT5020735.1 tRNA-dihydrouridine synthase family protein [Planctomicrobium sp.]MDB4742928.1 tRNA-dihydrouridine synthase family protein [Planctomicrobium sp.]
MSTTTINPLRIGSIELEHPFVQAALSGYSDWSMRALAREYGASYTVAEVMIDRFASEVKVSGKTAHHFRVEDSDHPVGAQLMGSDPEKFIVAAKRLVDSGFDVIDINFGCPVKSAIGGCRGGYHLGEPESAIKIIQSVRDTVPGEIPVTVKMRRGIDDTSESRDNFFQILEQAYSCGVAAVTVHGRTVEQKYIGPSNWDFLREVKEFAGENTVLGSGDLFSAEDCVNMLQQTGVDGVTIARGAIGNPWVFQQARNLLFENQSPNPPSIHEQRTALERHLELALLHHKESAIGAIRKFGFKYARLHPQTVALRKAFSKLRSIQDWERLLAENYAHDGPGIFPVVDEIQRP